MMNCPYCNKKVQIEDVVFGNVSTYQNPVIAKTNCCGRGVRVSARITYDISEVTNMPTHDQWGDELNQSKI